MVILGLEGLLTWKEKYWKGVLGFITIILVTYIVIYDEKILNDSVGWKPMG